MASFWDKMTGKAPFREVEEPEEKTNEAETSSDKNEESSDKKKASKEKKAKTEPEVKPGGNKKVKSRNGEFLKIIAIWASPIVAALAFMLVLNGIFSQINNPYDLQLANQKEEYSNILNEIDVMNNKYASMVAEEDAKTGSYYYNGDTSADDKIASAFFAKYTTWSSGDAYEKLRAEAEAAGFEPSGSFMSCFLPEQFAYTDNRYITHYSIDTYGENMSFDTLDSYPLSVDSKTNALIYGGIVTVSVKGNSTNGYTNTVYRKAYVTYSVINGTVTNVNAAFIVD